MNSRRCVFEKISSNIIQNPCNAGFFLAFFLEKVIVLSDTYLYFNNTKIMFLNNLIISMKQNQKGYSGKNTIAKLTAMPIDTMEDRFFLLLELASFADSLKIGKIADGKNPVPNLSAVRRILIESNSMSHNTTIVSYAFTNVMKELSFEIINATNNKGDFSKIPAIYS